MGFQETDAPVLFVFGQSNAHGNGARLPESEKITEPLANVFGLHRRYNQAYGLKDVVWSGFVTEGMNLGETQDHTCCLAESFAKIWQKRYSEKRADPKKIKTPPARGAGGEVSADIDKMF